MVQLLLALTEACTAYSPTADVGNMPSQPTRGSVFRSAWQRDIVGTIDSAV
jgi:hypothetical protein